MEKKMTVNPVDKAMDAFSQMMIERIEQIGNTKWQTPWFTAAAAKQAVNTNGRPYNGMNSIVLMMAADNYGYDCPVWGTFNAWTSYNWRKDENGKEHDADGNELPCVTIRKGEKSTPVFIYLFTVVHKKTGEKIPYDTYCQLHDVEKRNYTVFPNMHVFRVFNIAQTNMEQARPAVYAKMKAAHSPEMPKERKDAFKFGVMDAMIDRQSWLCPINLRHQDKAFYSVSRDAITYPMPEQFKDGESFYSNLLHEMAHSTGAKDRLGRLADVTAFNETAYAKEELVAELTAAFVCSTHGMVKHLSNDSAAYLKAWLEKLHESPHFIKSVLMDVKKASAMIEERFAAIEQHKTTAA